MSLGCLRYCRRPEYRLEHTECTHYTASSILNLVPHWRPSHSKVIWRYEIKINCCDIEKGWCHWVGERMPPLTQPRKFAFRRLMLTHWHHRSAAQYPIVLWLVRCIDMYCRCDVCLCAHLIRHKVEGGRDVVYNGQESPSDSPVTITMP